MPTPRREPADSARPGTHWRALIGDAPRGDLLPLALGFEVRVQDRRDQHSWSPPRSRTATPRDVAKGEVSLGVGIRPLTRSSATGAWIQADVGWDAVRRPGHRFDDESARWFSDLLGIGRDALLSGTAGAWLPLDLISSPLLWPHLRAAANLGIPFVAAQKHTTLTIAQDVALHVDVDRAADGSLALDAVLDLDGAELPATAARPIGRTGLFLAETVGARIRLVLAELPLTGPQRALLATGGAVLIPAPDEDAFLREAFPALARRTSLRAQGGIELPLVPRPEATLKLTHRVGDRVDYAFGWHYAGHGTFPLAASGEAVRDTDAERAVLPQLMSRWTEATGTGFSADGTLVDVDAAEFITHIVPRLQAAGIRVETHGTPRSYTELSGDPEITVSTVESSDPDWFDLGVLVTIDGRRIPFTPLFTALSMRRKKMLLSDGGWFSLAHPALQRLRDLLDEVTDLDEWETGPRISRHQSTLWDDFEDLADEARPARAWRETAEALRTIDHVPQQPVPTGLQATLRPYQQSGFEWLALLWQHRLGGILADDMGLGKTLQLLTLILQAKESGEERPFLVVAPTSVVTTWRQEAARSAPGLRVRVVGDRATSVTDAVADADIIVTSYALLRLEDAAYAAQPWAAVVLDEAQFVKNPSSQQHRAAAALQADAVFAVTGTPLENSLGDLWALLALTAPGLFASSRRFRQEYIQPIEQGKVPENAEGGAYRTARLERLRRRIRPLILRRTKQLVAPELPPKQEQTLEVDLSPAHRAAYDITLQRERQKVLGLLDDLDRNRFIVFRSLTLLRMLSLAPALLDAEDTTAGSAKLDMLVEKVNEMRAEGHRALVFSQFTSYLDLAAARLEAEGIAFARLDGSSQNREQIVDGFRAGEQPVFLISLKAGGFGITITEADYVFLLDPWWNPAAEAQAIDRTHRIGQRHPVMVYRMIATDTIEEKVSALQQRKARLFSAVMDDDDLFAQSLTADDIRGLFGDDAPTVPEDLGP